MPFFSPNLQLYPLLQLWSKVFDSLIFTFYVLLGGADKNTDAYCGIYGAGQDDLANDSPPDGAEDPLFSGQNR